MTDSFYNDAGEFTMVSHLLAQEVGLVCAAVYGAVWKKCQLEDGVCKASLDTLGSEIHLDRATVMRSIKKLCELGYLLDQTPDRRNAPHTYTLSKSVAECNSTTVVMRNSPKESVADDNKSVAHNNSSMGEEAQGDKTVAESHLKRVSSNPKSNPSKESKESSPPQKLFVALAELCHIELRAASEKQKGQLGKASKALVNLITDLDQFKAKFPVYWAAMDWRGQKGQSPDPPHIQETYGDFCHWLQNGAPTQVQKGQPTNGYHGPSQNLPRPDAAGETGGLSETSKALAAAWESKRRGSRNPT